MYNQIALQIIRSRTADVLEQARALALVNAAMADATIAGWDGKYYYLFWRPVHGIREASPGTGPTGKGDGNPDTVADPNWTPLGAPASNLVGPDFTPAFPAYPSGHAVTGTALFETLRKLYGEKVPFTFVSDEWNGVTRDNDGWVRPPAAQLHKLYAGGGRSGPEPDLPRRALAVRQDRRPRARPSGGGRRVPARPGAAHAVIEDGSAKTKTGQAAGFVDIGVKMDQSSFQA